MLGAAQLILETHHHPGQLRDMVTTPAGTTTIPLTPAASPRSSPSTRASTASLARRRSPPMSWCRNTGATSA
jgi:pyrroline-5-carboxylate reductase